jgi:iron(III) transport system permease protein
MARIVLPQMRLGLAATWVIVFVLAFGELGVSILVAPPGDATLPIRIYTMIANAPSSNIAAFALLQTAVILTGVLVLAVMASVRKAL